MIFMFINLEETTYIRANIWMYYCQRYGNNLSYLHYATDFSHLPTTSIAQAVNLSDEIYSIGPP